MANWLQMMLDRKNNEHTEERDGLWRKAKHTIFGSVCSDSSDAFRENKWQQQQQLLPMQTKNATTSITPEQDKVKKEVKCFKCGETGHYANCRPNASAEDKTVKA